jgi:hypothetical protein
MSLISLNSNANSISGQWSGNLNAMGNKVQLILNISRIGDNYSATLEVPSQNVYEKPIENFRYDDNTLNFELNDFKASYTGRISGEKIAGKWKQAGMEFDLIFTKQLIKIQSKKKKLKRK